MTARPFVLSLVLLASQLAACGGASVASPERDECRCPEPASAAVACPPPAAATRPGVVGAATQPAAPIPSAPAQQAAASRTVARSSAASTTLAAGPVRVHRIVLARNVLNRAPVESGERFAMGGDDRLYTWVEVENAGAEPAELVFTWIPPQGAPRGGQTLEVPSARRWRTWAFTRQARTPGEWTAEVRTSDGRLVARQSFTVEAPAQPAANPVPRS